MVGISGPFLKISTPLSYELNLNIVASAISISAKESDKHDATVACPACTQALLQEGADGEWEVKEEFRGKLRYLAETGDEAWQDHSQVITAVLENESGKLN
jgi:hypothetical protein